MSKHGLYKFISNGEIIYIGKSNSNIETRIKAHISCRGTEEKFKPYIKQGYEVYTCELPNRTETDLMERALINQYKPILNGSDNRPGFSGNIQVTEPNWVKYQVKDKKKPAAPKAKQKKEKPHIGLPDPIEYIYICDVGEGDKKAEAYLSNTIPPSWTSYFEEPDEAKDFLKALANVCNKHGKEVRGYTRVNYTWIKRDKILKAVYERDKTLELHLGLMANNRIKPFWIARDKTDKGVYQDDITEIYFSPDVIQFLNMLIEKKLI